MPRSEPISDLYPLRFQPIFRRYLWGGRRLAEHLNKPLGRGDDYAESWEIVDHESDDAIVASGPLRGTSLRELVARANPALFGRHAPQAQFPLLFKFLDAHRPLSVQVHPGDDQAARLPHPDRGKTEAWVILHADPGSRIYAGLKRGFDRHALEREVRRGTVELCLHCFEPRAGDCIFLPAGTVHALGAGLLVAEIQQSSDTTFRLYDWNRLGADGQPRPLHIEQALEVIDYEAGPVQPQVPQATDRAHVERLVACEKFVLDRWQLHEPATCGGDDQFHIVAVLDGRLQLAGDDAGTVLTKGETVLIPAACRCQFRPEASACLLDMYLGAGGRGEARAWRRMG